MSRKQVPSLYVTAVTAVSKHITFALGNHFHSNCDACRHVYHPEACPALRAMKEMLILPSSILCRIHEIIKDSSTYISIQREPVLQHYFYYMLENPQLKIESYCLSRSEDFFFVLKYGKYIQAMSFEQKCLPFYLRKYSDTWSIVLSCTANLQVIDVKYIKTNEKFFKTIGRGCNQLKKIKNFNMKYATVELARRLCFRDGAVKNNCCKTIQLVDIHFPKNVEQGKVSKKVAAIVLVLLSNLSSLQSLGEQFEMDMLFTLVDPHEIPVTSLADVNVRNVQDDVVQLLRKFCPKMNVLRVADEGDSDFGHLQSAFPGLQSFSVGLDHQRFSQLYQIITKSVWSMLKELNMDFSSAIIKIEDLADHLPVLETLQIHVRTLTWDGITSFNYLTVAVVHAQVSDHIFWFAAFAKTITSIELKRSFVLYEAEFCQVFLTVPFPKLDRLFFEHLKYDFDYISSVINVCPSLKELRTVVVWRLNQKYALWHFLRINNLDCQVQYSLIRIPVT